MADGVDDAAGLGRRAEPPAPPGLAHEVELDAGRAGVDDQDLVHITILYPTANAVIIPASVPFGPVTWPRMWQWNSQVPFSSGVNSRS